MQFARLDSGKFGRGNPARGIRLRDPDRWSAEDIPDPGHSSVDDLCS